MIWVYFVFSFLRTADGRRANLEEQNKAWQRKSKKAGKCGWNGKKQERRFPLKQPVKPGTLRIKNGNPSIAVWGLNIFGLNAYIPPHEQKKNP
jgi:hypothetical protein